MRSSIITIFVFLYSSFYGQKDSVIRNNTLADFISDYISIKYPEITSDSMLYVGVKRQKMYLLVNKEITMTYDVSTSKYGAGVNAGSEQTPIGLHQIYKKYGDDVPFGGVLKGKRFTGEIAEIIIEPKSSDKDEITTRIVTIRGLEPGINQGGALDSYNRYIYIHGTAEEGLIGQPASHGCIRMRNEDVIQFHHYIKKGTPLLIINN